MFPMAFPTWELLEFGVAVQAGSLLAVAADRLMALGAKSRLRVLFERRVAGTALGLDFLMSRCHRSGHDQLLQSPGFS